MLKVVVFDSGYGGEFFADQLEEEIPVLNVIRVIDWRNAKQVLTGPKTARKVAEAALRPYIGKVDLIIFANHLLTITSLRRFKYKYKTQKFVGLSLKQPDSFIKNDVLILTTSAVTKTVSYRNFIFHMKRKTKTLTLDDWPAKIDDGELTEQEIKNAIRTFLKKESFDPKEIILACSQFNDIKKELRTIFGYNIKIYDSFDDTIRQTCKALRLRGGTGKKQK